MKAKEITVDNIKIEVLAKGDCARYLGQKITFEEQETEEIKKKTESSVCSVPQISPRAYLERLPTVPQITSFQHDHHADIDLRKSGTWTLPHKHKKMIKTAQRKMLRLIVQTIRKNKSKSKKEVADMAAEEIKKYDEERKNCETDKEELGQRSRQ